MGKKVRKKSWFRKKSGLSGCGDRTRTCDLRVMRQSQGQIGVISAPICAFYRHSFGEFSIVSVQACPLFSDSGSKLGQKLSMNGLQSGNPRHRCFIFEPHPSHTLDGFTFFKDFATIKREEIYRAEVYDSEGTLAVPRGTLRDNSTLVQGRDTLAGQHHRKTVR